MAAPRKLMAVVTGIRQFEGSVTLFTLTTEVASRFKPGQFLHLALDPYDPSFNWPESRVFSIANAPNRENEIEILVSPKGAFTNRMIKGLNVGSQVWIKLPFGIFNFDAVKNRNVVLLAGGTGISPFLSLLRQTLEYDLSYQSLTLFYGVKNPGLIIFDELLKECLDKIRGFTCQVYCENGMNIESQTMHSGMLPVTDIVNKFSEKADALYYISGPKTMIETFENELIRRGVGRDNIIYDRWE